MEYKISSDCFYKAQKKWADRIKAVCSNKIYFQDILLIASFRSKIKKIIANFFLENFKNAYVED